MRRLRNILIVIVLLIALIAGAGAGTLIYTTRRMLPQYSGTLSLAGLDGKVEIYRDASGIPQIYATTTKDLFFAQGVVTAQDRWWEMEFNRHVAMGRISELVGNKESALRNDIFIRTVGWNRAAQADLDTLAPETKVALDAYSSGVNAYIEGKSGADLAVEYSILGLTGVNIPIEKWQPLHSIAWAEVMSYSLSDNFDRELELAKLYQKMPDKKDLIDKYYAMAYPFDNRQTILTAEDMPIKPDAVTTYNAPPIVAPGTDFTGVQTTLVGDVKDVVPNDIGLGSNNWVISGKLTASGKPLLANDPHLGIQMPSIWYQVGLHCVQLSTACPYDVEGFTFPGTPGIVIGHNSRIAWGVTNGTVDTQDLYIIKVDPNDPNKYELDGQSTDMQVITETIKFGDNTPSKDIKVRLTHFGPIITDAPSYAGDSQTFGNRPLALKWVATAEKFDLLGSVLAINRATDWTTFRQALTNWAMPAQNFVFADVDGNIGYQLPGLMPIRAKDHSGLTPVDGSTTQYDWKGYIPFEYLPHTYNPPRGYIETANQAIVPLSYFAGLADALGDKYGKDSNYRFQYHTDYGYRGNRIVALITGQSKHTVDTIKTIQGDDYNGSAAEILPAVLKLDFGSDIPKDVLAWMGNWDYQDQMNSGQAALYETFWAKLDNALWGTQFGYTPDESNVWWGTNLLLAQSDSPLWDNPLTTTRKETSADVLRTAFVDAYKSLVTQLGADYNTWKWGTLHTATFVSNPLGASGISLIEKFVNGGPVTVNGGSPTINRTGWSASSPYSVSSISSMRLIMDLSDFNKSQWIQSTGVSGHPMSDHYRDLTDKWRTIQYDPMLWDAAAIKAAAMTTLILQPK